MPDGESEVDVIVGYVSGVGGRRGVVVSEDQEVSFPLDVAPSLDGYRPHVNDWVKVGVRQLNGSCDIGGCGCSYMSHFIGQPCF